MPTLSAGAASSETDQTPWETATFTKPDVTAAGSSGAWTTANSPITIATVTGIIQLRMFGVVTASFTSTGNNGTIAVTTSVGVPSAGQQFINSITANGTQAQTGYVMGSGSVAGAMAFGITGGQFVPVNGGNIVVVIATNNMTAGGCVFYFQWIAATAGATLSVATP